MTAQIIVKKCIHDLTPSTCFFCKDKPQYKNYLLDNSDIKAADRGLKNNQTERGQVHELKTTVHKNHQNIQKEEKIMTEKKVCIICGETHKARGLCDKHHQAWRDGRIEHPELGKWKISEKGKKISIGLTKKNKKKIEQQNPVSESDSDDMNTIFSALRTRLKEARSLAESLIIIGKSDQVKKEIDLFAQRFE